MFLFEDEIPVSEAEVQAFLDAIPNLSASTFRREAYRRAYRVEDKIRSLKARERDKWQSAKTNSSSKVAKKPVSQKSKSTPPVSSDQAISPKTLTQKSNPR